MQHSGIDRRNTPHNAGPRTAAVLTGVGTFTALCALPHLVPPWTVNHDVAWFVHAAERWLAGDRLYVDLVDPNLPLVTYLTAVPVAAA